MKKWGSEEHNMYLAKAPSIDYTYHKRYPVHNWVDGVVGWTMLENPFAWGQKRHREREGGRRKQSPGAAGVVGPGARTWGAEANRPFRLFIPDPPASVPGRSQRPAGSGKTMRWFGSNLPRCGALAADD